jgi:hypothetical protein
MRGAAFGLAAIALIGADAAGQTQALPPQIAAVQKYILETDYPEVFGDTNYRTKIENAVVADINGDNELDVIVHFKPHYRQSPTIVFYHVSKDMVVTRITEGLAPGPLEPLNGDYLDSHVGGRGVDFHLDGMENREAFARRKTIGNVLAEFGGVVEYTGFYHSDGRKGRGVYVDMTGLAEQPKEKNCENFQFAALKQIGVGIVPGAGVRNLLAAWAGGKVYLYQIGFFEGWGFLDKQIWTVDLAADFRGFAPVSGGKLSYVTASGAEKPFAVTCTGARCTQAP